MLREKVNSIDEVKASMPFSIRKAATQLQEHFNKFIDVDDLDQQTIGNIKRMFFIQQDKAEEVSLNSTDDELETEISSSSNLDDEIADEVVDPEISKQMR